MLASHRARYTHSCVSIPRAHPSCPGPWLDGESVFKLMRDFSVTFSVGVPTVWMNLLAYMEANSLRPSAALRSVCIGGSAAPRSMIDAFEIKYG